MRQHIFITLFQVMFISPDILIRHPSSLVGGLWKGILCAPSTRGGMDGTSAEHWNTNYFDLWRTNDCQWTTTCTQLLISTTFLFFCFSQPYNKWLQFSPLLDLLLPKHLLHICSASVHLQQTYKDNIVTVTFHIMIGSFLQQKILHLLETRKG